VPRLTKQNPKYRRHKPSGRGVVTIDGKDIYLGRWNSPESVSEYHRLIAQWNSNGRRLPSAGSDLTIAELVEQFGRYIDVYYRRPDGTPTGEAATFRSPLKVLMKLFGSEPAMGFDSSMLKTVRDALIERGLSRKTVNGHIVRIRRIFSWGASPDSGKLVPHTIAAELEALPALEPGRSAAREPGKVLPVSDETVQATLPYLPGDVRAMVELQRLTGMRSGEVTAMRIGQLDRSGETWCYSPGQHKTAHKGKDRHIAIGPRGQQILQPFLFKLDADAYVFSRGSASGSNHHYTPHSYGRIVRRAADRADAWAKAGKIIDNKKRIVLRWHVHQLRHTYATQARKIGGLEAAQVALGHSTAKITEVYAERDAALAAKIAQAIG